MKKRGAHAFPQKAQGTEPLKEIDMKWRILVFSALLTFLAASPFSEARMTAASDPELDSVYGQTGLTIVLPLNVTADYVTYTNTDDGSSLECQNAAWDDGSGGVINIPGGMALDICTDGDRSFLKYTLSETLTQGDGRYLTTTSMELNGTYAGSLALENLRNSESYLMIGSHTDGSTGVDMRLEAGLSLGSLAYEIAGDELAFEGMFLSLNPGGTAQNPSMGAGRAVIGATSSWAQLDIGSDSGDSCLLMTIPVEGTLRVNTISFCGQDWGAAALDDMNGTIQVRAPAGATWQY